MPVGANGQNFLTTLKKQLDIEAGLLESHLAALDRELAKVIDQNKPAARWMQEAIRIKRRRLESIRRQQKRLEEN